MIRYCYLPGIILPLLHLNWCPDIVQLTGYTIRLNRDVNLLPLTTYEGRLDDRITISYKHHYSTADRNEDHPGNHPDGQD